MDPVICIDSNQGYHNLNMEKSMERLTKAGAYRDLSTICVIPTRGQFNFRVVQALMGLMNPMNQKFTRVFISGMEVGAAYENAVEMILANPELSKWKYMLTIEEDNLPPPDGLLKLYESMDSYDVVGGLYWTKGEGGMPMCYGSPESFPIGFNPQIPKPESVTPCNGLGMGFTLFKLDVFRKVERPWFKTEQTFDPVRGTNTYTQDLYFASKAIKNGIKFACDSRIKVGHLDTNTGIVW